MPALRLFGKALTVSADDLVLPALVGLASRGVAAFLVIVVASIVVSLPTPLGCVLNLDQPSDFVVGILCSLCFTAIVYISIFYYATRGTLVEYELRESTDIVVYILFFAYLFQAAISIVGIAVAVSIVNEEPAVLSLSNYQSGGSVLDQCVFHKQLIFYFTVFGVLALLVDFVAFVVYCLVMAVGITNLTKDKEVMIKRFETRFKVGCTLAQTVTCHYFGTVNSPLGKAQEDLAFRDIATVFSSFFHGTSFDDKLVLTDMVAAVLLLRVVQLAQSRRNLKYSMISPLSSPHSPFGENTNLVQNDSLLVAVDIRGDRSSLQTFLYSAPSYLSDPSASFLSDPYLAAQRANNEKLDLKSQKNKTLFKILKDAYDFRGYMVGIYGEVIHILMQPVTGTCDLFCAAPCDCTQTYKGDKLHLGVKTLEIKAGMKKENLLYAAFTSYVGQALPYAIAIDHDLKSVIVVCRGTLTFPDLMTDALIEPVPLNAFGQRFGFDGTGHFVHGGMFSVALSIHEDIQKHGILHRLLKVKRSESEREGLGNQKPLETLLGGALHQNLESLLEYPSYDLVIIGHSLGAAAASLLSLIMRPAFPKLRCIGYAMPGCVMSRGLCEIVSEWTSTIWFGKYMVPRLSWRNFLILRGQLLDVLRRSKASKYRTIASVITNEGEDALLFEERKVPQHPFRKELEGEIRRLAQINVDPSPLEKIPMFIPGKLLHLDRLDDPEISNDSCTKSLCVAGCALFCSCNSCFKQEALQYFPVLIEDRSLVTDILISPRMLLDHLPDVAAHAIEQLYHKIQNENA